MRLPGITIRRLMIATALVGALIGFALMALRSMEYRRLAIHHEEICAVLSGEVASLTGQAEEAKAKDLPTAEHLINARERRKAFAEEARIASVYRRLMWHPWQQVRYRPP